MAKKFSEFVSGGDLRVGDTVVGIRDGVNTKFDSPGTGIKDINGSYILKYETTSPGVTDASNYPLIIAQRTGLERPYVTYSANGPETNISLNILPKGDGYILLGDSSQAINFVSDNVTLMDADPEHTLCTEFAIKSYVDSVAGGLVDSVTGVANRITISGTSADPIVDISSSYVGQSTITTLGTVSSGVWNGTVVSSQYGGTGVNNGSNTITLAGNLVTSGAFNSTFTMTGATNVTFPTSGTLATTTGNVASATNVSGGTANDIVYQTGVGTTGFITETANGVLVYSGAGVPSSSTTLPSGLAISTPASGTLTNCTGLPVSTGISGLASGMATFLATPTSANLAATVTNETGSGALVFATSPTLVTPILGAATGTSLNLSGLTASQAVVTDGSKNLTSLGYSSSASASVLVSYDSNSNLNGSNVISNYTRITSAAGTTSLTISSTKYIFLTGVTTHTIQLPAVATFTPGNAVTYIIVNQSSGNCIVNTSGGNNITTLTNLQRLEITWLGTGGAGTGPWTGFVTNSLL